MVIMESILYPCCECPIIFRVLFIGLLFKVLSFLFEVLSNVHVVHLSLFSPYYNSFVY